jgi:hypothetical protein
MFETIHPSLCATRAGRRTSEIQFRTIAVILLCNLLLVPIAWSKELSDDCGKEKNDSYSLNIGFALAQPPIIEAEAQQVALNFVGNTLRHLLADDLMLASLLGFTRTQDLQNLQESGAVLESPLPIHVINLKDLRDFVRRPTLPLALLARDINWTRVSDTDFAPTRFLFPIRLTKDAGNTGSAAKSSVIIEKTPMNVWRIHQAGGPALMRALKTYSTSKKDFVVWIPGINRHYLGRMGPDFRLKITVLFDDPVAQVNAGHEFDPCDSQFREKLKQLDRLLETIMTTEPVSPAPVTPRGGTTR